MLCQGPSIRAYPSVTKKSLVRPVDDLFKNHFNAFSCWQPGSCNKWFVRKPDSTATLSFFSPKQPFFHSVLFFESWDCVKRESDKEKKNWEEDSSDPLLKRFRVRISRWLIYHGATQSLIRIPAGGVAVLWPCETTLSSASSPGRLGDLTGSHFWRFQNNTLDCN